MNSTKSIAALFDFDGVVMDTETQYSIFWNEQGRKYHPELPEFGRLIKGQTLTQIYASISSVSTISRRSVLISSGISTPKSFPVFSSGVSRWSNLAIHEMVVP